jgi:hypothetical protein
LEFFFIIFFRMWLITAQLFNLEHKFIQMFQNDQSFPIRQRLFANSFSGLPRKMSTRAKTCIENTQSPDEHHPKLRDPISQPLSQHLHYTTRPWKYVHVQARESETQHRLARVDEGQLCNFDRKSCPEHLEGFAKLKGKKGD